MKLLTLLSGLLLSTAVFAQTPAASPSVKNAATALNTVKSCEDNCFRENIVGMKDNLQETIVRSQKDGAAIQYLLFTEKGIEKLGMDGKLMAQEINEIVNKTAKYYKTKPALKGAFLAFIRFYPGYKSAFQVPLDKVPAEHLSSVKSFNEILKTSSVCNKEGFCGLLALEQLRFVDSTGAATPLNLEEYNKFASQFPRNNIEHYPSKKDNLMPLQIVLVLGTNGYHVEEEDVKKFMQLSQK